MTAPVRRRFTTIGRIRDDLAADPTTLGMYRGLALTQWHSRVDDLPGALAVGEPEITVSDNLHYGCETVGEDDTPILGEAGQPVLDRDRLVMRVSGWVDMPQEVWERAEGEARRLAAQARHAERQP